MTPCEFVSAIEDAEVRGDWAAVKALCNAFDAAYPTEYFFFCEEVSDQ